MVVPAFVAMSRPWLVAWSLSTLIDAPDTPAQQAAAEELSLLMRFRADHFDTLFDFAGAGDTHANDHAARLARGEQSQHEFFKAMVTHQDKMAELPAKSGVRERGRPWTGPCSSKLCMMP